MNAFVAAFLAQDGLANEAIYCLLALALVLVFAVTRIIFIPQGEFIVFSALSYVTACDGRVPGTVGLLCVLGGLSGLIDGLRGIGWRRVLGRAAWPFAVALGAAVSTRMHLPAAGNAVVAVILVSAMGTLLYRIVYRRIAAASPLVLLIVAMANHLVLLGLGLYFFGPEGVRAPPLINFSIAVMGVPILGQTLLIFAASAVLLGALFLIGETTLYGKAMRAASINPVGAQLLGVSSEMAGEIAFLVTAFIGGVSGVLISSGTTLYYDSGFLLGLKGFVAGILGGMASFLLAGIGAFALGLLESFASFYASSFKEVPIFSMIIPILPWRSRAAR